MVGFGPPVHSVRTFRNEIWSAPFTLMASPMVSSTAKSRSVTPLLVTMRPSLPAFCFRNEKMVLSWPAPFNVTPSTSRLSPIVNSKTPSLNSMTVFGSARINAS